MELILYTRKAYYYETDRMNIVHHSNYVRWLEEARVDMMNQMGCTFAEVEKRGLMVPVLSVECQYRYPVRFDEQFEVRCTLSRFNGCEFEMTYEIYNITQDKRAVTAKSSHCFTDENLRPARIRKSHPDIYKAFADLL